MDYFVEEVINDCFLMRGNSFYQLKEREILREKIYSFIRNKIVCNFKMDLEKIIIKRNIYGKPYLDKYHNFGFSISYTYNASIVIFSETEIGIDIEYIKDIKDIKDKFIYRFFVEDERTYIMESNDKIIEIKRFYEVWTKKEAYIKWCGKGLSIPLNSFSIFDKELSKHFITIYKEKYVISIFSIRKKSIAKSR